MLTSLLPLLILSVAVTTYTDPPSGHWQELRRWDFEAGDDSNYDRWPDDWTRRKGTGYPLYLPVEIVEDDQPRPTGQHALRMQLDGGAALVYSPPIPISPLFSYVLDGFIKTEGLRHNVAYASVMFYDQDLKLIETIDSKHYQHEDVWTPFQIGPVTPASDQVRWAAVALHLRPTTKADLSGAAMFDDLRLTSRPRIALETNQAHRLYADAKDVQVRCQVSGISHAEPRIRFELLDVYGQSLAVLEQPAAADKSGTKPDAVFSGFAIWKPPIPDFGFYRVRASIVGQSSASVTTSLAVLTPLAHRPQGEFGWTLSHGERPLPLKALAGLLEEVGVHWVKLPVWFDAANAGRADELAWFAERLSARKINLVGVLDQPPAAVRDLFSEHHRLPVASVFLEPEVWQPAVTEVLTRLALKVRWWQLGADHDTSFASLPQLETKLGEIRTGFNRFGQQIHVGIPWRAIDEVPAGPAPPWSFLSFVASPPLTADELQAHLASTVSTSAVSTNAVSSNAPNWHILESLPKSIYDLETRTVDLVARMVTAQKQGSQGIFHPDPFHAEFGLMQEDGSPGELLLPWRTTAKLITGTEYLGSVRLPNGSLNHVFDRDGEAIMIVWNEAPVRETLYLGDDVRMIDVWGREQRPPTVPEDGFVRQAIDVTRLPIFLTGVDPHIARWRIQFRLEENQLASVFGREQTLHYWITNPYDYGVSGTVKLQVPESWEATPPRMNFKLSPHESQRHSLRVTLPPNTSSGEHPLQTDFAVTTGRTMRFSVFGSLHVGTDDLLVELTSRIDDHGQLIVEQRLTNNTDRLVSMNCYLSTSQRRRERQQLFNLGRGTTLTIFTFPQGEELLGETLWLRVEEIDGARILNYQIIAQE